MQIDTDFKKIEELLTRGTEDIIDRKDLSKALSSGRQLRIKLGIDPTGSKIHLGRASILFKLRDFQRLGHKIVLIIGNFTALIGDASDKESMRPVLTKESIEDNLKDYLNYIGKIIDLSEVEVHYNKDWFGEMKLEDIIRISMNFTAQQMINRRNFKERWDTDKPIGIHEILYPMLQGYDSVKINSDVEIGGFDQLFNLKTGRDLQRVYGQEPQNIMTLKMIYGLDGRKMSTSWGNVINISDTPNDMFGKLMSLKDELINDYFICCTRIEMEKVNEYKEQMEKEGINPKMIKKILAKEIICNFYSEEEADSAEREWENQFENKELPSEIEEVLIEAGEMNILDLVVLLGLSKSKGEARRVLEQGGIKIIYDNDPNSSELKSDWQEVVQIKKGMIVQSGKRYYKKIV
ncbi:MAG: tyrosine--tRNA ligase [Candidatus Pacebacteria bacterium]|nr:tyrosine--tRNA ligase [Candidatus Paceibacterota bacterium]